MKKTIITVFSTILMFTAFVACDNDEKNDSDQPSIVYLSPDKDAHYLVGGSLEVASDIKAQAGIKEIKIDIHYGAGHSHDHSSVRTEDHGHDHEEVANAWSQSRIITEAGNKTNYSLSEYFTIPNDAALGDYHVGILVTDNENREVKEYRTIKIDKE